MKQTYVEKWRCESCDDLHDDEDEARECCEPEVSQVYICIQCKKEFNSRKAKDAAACHPSADVSILDAEACEGSLCLCGARLLAEDYRPSLILGSQIYCERCRDKVLDGIPSNEAIRRSFIERGIEVR